MLLIEDETSAREAAERSLEQFGARVRAVSSAQNARDALRVHRPDVIVADIGMPGEDGYTFVKSIRREENEEQLPRIPAIAVTAFARVEDREAALAAGFDDHLPKPVDVTQLATLLMKLIQRRN